MATGHNTSFWEETSLLAPADVLIIGSGIVGLNTAITIRKARPDLSVLVVDRGSAPIGASTRNAGFACFGSLTEVVSDIESIGYDEALKLMELRRRGLERLISITGEEAIEFERYGGYEVFLEEDQENYSKGLDWVDRINGDLASVFGGDFFVPFDQEGLSGHMDFLHCVAHPFEGQLHPGKMVAQLQKVCLQLGVRVLYGAEVTAIDEEDKHIAVHTAIGMIRAHHVVLATNGFAKRFLPELELQPARNQVLLTEPLSDFAMRGCFHYKQGYVYFRNVGDRLLIGGARHMDMERESTSEFGLTNKITSWLTEFAEQHVVGRPIRFSHSWSGILGVGPSKQPIVKHVSERMTAAVRLGGMGVAIGSVVGQKAAEKAIEAL